MGRARARVVSLVLAIMVAAAASIAWPALGASAAPAPVAKAPDPCSIEQWKADFRRCVAALPEVGAARAQCLKAPTPSNPDSGLAGWFAERPDSAEPGPAIAASTATTAMPATATPPTTSTAAAPRP